MNPDAFKVDGKIKRVLKKDRYENLIQTINSWKQTKPLVVHYMYYDTNDGELCIASHEDFRKETLDIIQY